VAAPYKLDYLSRLRGDVGAFSALPVRPQDVTRDLLAALRGRLAHNVGERNAVQKAMYIGVLGVICLVVLFGLSIWPWALTG
jgi:thiosulfate reductase cytochrome b subunit